MTRSEILQPLPDIAAEAALTDHYALSPAPEAFFVNTPGDEALDDQALLDSASVLEPRPAADRQAKVRSDSPDVFAAHRFGDDRVSVVNGLATYLRRISQHKLEDDTENVELSKDIEAGLYAERLLQSPNLPVLRQKDLQDMAAEGCRAKQRMIEANLQLVASISKRYFGRSLQRDDFIQEGVFGLVRAIEKFDYTKGYAFSTYATWWIRKAMGDALMGQDDIVTPPRVIAENSNRLRTKQKELYGYLKKEPSIAELAASMDMSHKEVEELMAYNDAIVSLNSYSGQTESDGELGDLIADELAHAPEDAALTVTCDQLLSAVINTLSPRHQDYIRRYFGLGDYSVHTYQEIGNLYGITGNSVGEQVRLVLRRLSWNDKLTKDLLR